MIHLVRRKGHDMFRAYCDDCEGFCHGSGKSRYLTYWVAKAGAARAAKRHAEDHERHGQLGRKPYVSQRLPYATMRLDYNLVGKEVF